MRNRTQTRHSARPEVSDATRVTLGSSIRNEGDASPIGEQASWSRVATNGTSSRPGHDMLDPNPEQLCVIHLRLGDAAEQRSRLWEEVTHQKNLTCPQLGTYVGNVASSCMVTSSLLILRTCMGTRGLLMEFRVACDVVQNCKIRRDQEVRSVH